MRVTALLPVAGVVGGIYSAGFLFGYNYHKKFSEEEEAGRTNGSPASIMVEPPAPPAPADAEAFSTNKLIYKFGLPLAGPTLHYANHVVLYDQLRRTPRWVAETLTEVSYHYFVFHLFLLVVCLSRSSISLTN